MSRINLTDSKDDIKNKIQRAKTDTNPITEDETELLERPEILNLVGIYSSLSGEETKNILSEFSGKDFSEFKKRLAELVVEKISPISKEINRIMKDPKYIDDVLSFGSESAEKIASKKVKEMKKIMGF